ncbi:MAG TPA: YARHG domain-containing protein [Pyrinomonadaceae bacterium]
MRRSFRSALLQSLLAAFLLLAPSAYARAQTQADFQEWEKFDFAKQSVELAQIQEMPLEDLRLLRGLVFGRHGRVFKDADIRDYLKGRPWFKPDPNFQNSLLNETERANLDIIREAESKKHDFIEPGDLRFHRARPFTVEQLGEHTAGEWRILLAEVEAIHGKRFDEEPWLKQYFEERYWYEPNAQYDPQQLSRVERQNIQTIAAAQKKQRHLALSPGDMELFENQALTEKMLRGLSLHELRLLRNEVYARHGRVFGPGWLQQYFDSQPWYSPREEGQKPTELSAIEKQNIDIIVAYEKRLRDELSAKPISRLLLEGLFAEDARKLRSEIYARHGKVFKDKSLQKYFASLDWYKPDPHYSDQALNPMERKNAAVILTYERKADSVLNAVEG